MPHLRPLCTVLLIPLLVFLLAMPSRLHASDLEPRPVSPSWTFSRLWTWLPGWTRQAGLIPAFDFLGRDMDPNGANADPEHGMDPGQPDGDLGRGMDPNG